jgi:hypothetical protein
MFHRSSEAVVSAENHRSAKSGFQRMLKDDSVINSWYPNQWLATGTHWLYLTWGLAMLTLMIVTVVTVYWFVSASLS